MNYFLHGGDYNPDHWLQYPDILKDDLKMMKDGKINTVTLGVFDWSSIEPSEGHYNFDWLDKIFEDINKMGGRVILATPSGAKPQWMSKEYPEINRVDGNGTRHTAGFRHNHCFSSPIYRREVKKIDTMLAERYGKNPALLMWHVSNEFSGECYCDLCANNWRKWVKNKYQTLENLNESWYMNFWGGAYSNWGEILPPNPLGESGVHEGMDLDWKRFVTDMTIDFYDAEAKTLREITPDIPITTNFMADGPDKDKFIPKVDLDYSKFAKHLDVVSWDSYPAWHNNYESLAETAMQVGYVHDQFYSLKHQPFLVMESTPSQVNWMPYAKSKKPGMHMLSSMQQIAHGSDSTLYFQMRQGRAGSEKYHGAVIGHDNSEDNRVFKEVAEYGKRLEKISEIQGAVKEPRVAIVYDWESNWTLNSAVGFGRPTKLGVQTLQKHYSIFWGQNIPVEIVRPDDDLSKYDLLIAPMLYLQTEDTMLALQNYVRNGGTLVSSYLSGMVDSNDRVYLGGFPDKLQKLFGIKTKEMDTLYPNEHNTVKFGYTKYRTHDYDEVIETTTGNVLAAYQEDFFKQTPAVVENQFGKGKAYYIAARMGRDFLKDFYEPIIDQLHLTDDFVGNPEYEVSCQTRIKNGNKYHFLMNFSEATHTVELLKPAIDVETGEKVDSTIVLRKYEVRVLKEA